MANAVPAEPSPARFRSPLTRAIAASRPAFLSVTAVAVLVGIANAALAGSPIRPALALATLLLALLAHAAGNLLNDWADAGNGSDAINQARLFPFTGGSRFIDNGVMTRAEVGALARTLALSTITGGILLTLIVGPWLLALGAAGLLLAWAYSAPPLWLVARALGELSIACAWLLVVIGADGVLRGVPAASAAVAGLPLALLVANILFVNQFPDREADAAVGKRTLVVRLGAERARGGSAVLAVTAHGWLLGAVLVGALPSTALAALVAAPLSGVAARGVWRHASHPAALAPSIRLTIAAACLHGLAMALGLWLAR
jgi:1,4-dihydroxy-2-naphthoate octaprenyltransferase